MRRKKVLKDLNLDLISLADQVDTFLPLLFGQGFARKTKDHSEEFKSLRKAAPSSLKSFFQWPHLQEVVPGGAAETNSTSSRTDCLTLGEAVAEPVQQQVLSRAKGQGTRQTSKFCDCKIGQFVLVIYLSEIGVKPMDMASNIIAGRIQLHAGNWRAITKEQWVLHAI